MLPSTADFWAREVEAMKNFRALHLEAFKEIVKLQVGKYYRSDYSSSAYDRPENDVQTYKAFMLPELAFGTPAARVTAKRPSQHEEIADALDAALESWIADSSFTTENQSVVDSALSGYAIVHVGVEPVDYVAPDEGGLRVYACEVSADNFLIDRKCKKRAYARVMGHEYERDLDQLLADPRIDTDAKEKLAEMQSEADGPEGDGEGGSAAAGDVPDRKVVHLIDLYLCESRQIATLAQLDGTPKPFWVRKPAPYWGPKSGGYVIYGMYTIRENPLPMGPIQPWLEQSQEKNAHLAAAATEAAAAKTFYVVDAQRPDVQSALLNAKNMDVIPVKDIANAFVKVEIGAMSGQRLEYVENSQTRLDRVQRLSDAQRGRASGATATESQIVQSNADVGTEWLRMQVVLGTRNVFKAVLWYFIHDPNVVQKVSRQDPRTGQLIEGLFLGGPQPGQDEVDENDFEVEVDPQSMQRSDDTVLQQRWLQLLDAWPKLVAMAQSGGNVRWWTDQYGSTINQRRLSEMLFMQGMLPLVPPAGMGMGLPGQMNGQMGGAGAIPPIGANLNPQPNPNMGNQLAGGGGFPMNSAA